MRISSLVAAPLVALALACSDDAPAIDTTESGVPGAGGAWQQQAPLPTPRSEVASAVLDGQIYVIGGYIAQGSASDLVDVYDPQADRWERRAPLPAPRDHAMAVSFDGKVYVFGGNSGNESNSAFAYDPDTDRWTTLREMPFRRAAGGAAVLDGAIIIVGGTGENPTATHVYHPEDDAWSKGRPLPAPREHLAVAEVAGRVYVIGGRWENMLMSTNEMLEAPLGEWTTLAPLPTARGGNAAGSLGRTDLRRRR